MLTAQEARKKVEALASERREKERLLVETTITQAVEKGLSSCILEFYVLEDTEKWLLALGYQVERSYNRDGDFTTKITW